MCPTRTRSECQSFGGFQAHAQLSHSQLSHWLAAHWQVAQPPLAQSQVVHLAAKRNLEVAQPQVGVWAVTDDDTAAWMAGVVISGLQRGLVKPEFFAHGALST